MEVELKLALDPRKVERLRAAPLLAHAPAGTIRMDGIYLDTPDCELARHGMALRLRRANGRWMQALKAGRSGTGGLHSRGEWEYEQPRAEVDLARFRDTPLAALRDPETLHERLAAAFRVTFVREAWQVEPAPGTRLEVALDRGEVRGGRGREALCEVEIECLEGDPACVFDVAEALLRSVPLAPSATTKARRGYRLFRGEKPSPVHAIAPRVRRDMSPEAAARAIVAAGLEQLGANEEGLLASDDPEFLHQARVALRRIRSALRMLRKPIGAKRADAWREALAQAARCLGEARDWDVFATETLPAFAEAYGNAELGGRLARRAAKQQRRARASARRAIRSRTYLRAILRLSRWLAIPRKARQRRGTLEEFAGALLAKRHARLTRGLKSLDRASPAERHDVRIDAKRLRYVVEGLAPALNPSGARRYARRLSRLQDSLGRANDAVTARRLLRRLDPPRELGAFAKDWFDARMATEEPRIARLAGEIADFKAFWRDP